MRLQSIELPAATPASRHIVQVERYGTAGARPCVYIQASLHADELPGMLTACALRLRLLDLEACGRLRGEIILVPVANPIGLAQSLLGQALGRFDLADGVNFNRRFPDLSAAAITAVADRLSDDPDHNVALFRTALSAALDAIAPVTPAERLKHCLMSLALTADWSLDLHCDFEATLHLYTLTPSADAFMPLARVLGAKAMLLAEESGDHPFDEALSRPWHALRQAFPDCNVPMGCQSATIELRGAADVDDQLAAQDAEALIAFMSHVGAIDSDDAALPVALCLPSPLAGVDTVKADRAGLIVFRKELGALVAAGEAIADLVDPLDGSRQTIRACTDGVLFVRCTARMARAGQSLAKIAGPTAMRSGPLLSP
jgi:uncharacterized protein